MRLQIVTNSTFEEEKALINIDTKQILVHGDYYHDKIDEYITGFLNGLSFARISYELLDNQVLTPDMEMFNICGFENNNYDDCEEDEVEDDDKDCLIEDEVESNNKVKNDEMELFNFVIYGDNIIHTYCNIIEALEKTRSREADLYHERDSGREDIVYSCFGLEFEDNNELLSKYGVIIDEETNKIQLLVSK